jgi:uroporphyrin-III C-methyltransferase
MHAETNQDEQAQTLAKPASVHNSTPEPTSKKSSRLLVWLTMLVAIAAIAGVAFLWQRAEDAQLNYKNLSATVTKLADPALAHNSIPDIKSKLAALQAKISSYAKQQNDNMQNLSNAQDQLRQLSDSYDKLETSLRDMHASVAAPDLRSALLQVNSWVISANIALQANRDVSAAKSYLQSSIKLLSANAKDAAVISQLQLNLKNISKTKVFDKDKVATSLDNISALVAKLKIIPPSKWKYSDKSKPQTNADQSASWHSLKSSLAGLKKLFVFRKVSDAESAQMKPGQLVLVRNIIQQKLANAQWAALHNDSSLYKSNLSAAQMQVNTNFLFATDQSKQISEAIDKLLGINVNPVMPNLDDLLVFVREQLQHELKSAPAPKKMGLRNKKKAQAPATITPPGTNFSALGASDRERLI